GREGEHIALEVLRKGQSQHPNDFWLNLELGHTLISQVNKTPEHAGEAVGYLRAALAFRPTSAEIYHLLGWALIDRGALAAAQRAIDRSLQLRADDASVECLRGTILGKKGDGRGMIATYRKAVQLAPTDEALHLNLALALAEQGMPGEAEKAF